MSATEHVQKFPCTGHPLRTHCHSPRNCHGAGACQHRPTYNERRAIAAYLAVRDGGEPERPAVDDRA